MIFISAGHHAQAKNIKPDPGAVANGYKEGDLTIEFRDLVCKELDAMGVKYIKDSDEESLVMYLNRIKTGSGSVVIEYHFDAASNISATGTTSLVEEDSDRLDMNFAKEIANSTATILGIRNRGVMPESQSYRKRLALMREEGIICLCEIGFITNINDLAAYHRNKVALAKDHARILKKYEDFIV